MRRYETTYILRPNLGEEQFSEIIERTNNIITGDGGAIINLERWGNRKLAYEIRKENLGQYVYLDYAAPGATIQEMERIFRIDDNVLRFLTVKLADSIDEATITSETERVAAALVAADETSEEEVESASDDQVQDKTDEPEGTVEEDTATEQETEEDEADSADEAEDTEEKE